MRMRTVFLASFFLAISSPCAYSENITEATALDGDVQGENISTPHEASTEFDVVEPPPPADAPVTGAEVAGEEQAQGSDASEAGAESAVDNNDPLPWDEFFRQMVEEAGKPAKGERRPGNVELGGVDGKANSPPSILDPADSLASRLVGAFRVRRDKEDAFEGYIEDESNRERLIFRLEGLLGNTAVIVVTEVFEDLEPNEREAIGIRWATKWHEICGTPISRTTLYSLRNGELVDYSFYSDQSGGPGSDHNPLAMLAPLLGQDIDLQGSVLEDEPTVSAKETPSGVYFSETPELETDGPNMLIDEEVELEDPNSKRGKRTATARPELNGDAVLSTADPDLADDQAGKARAGDPALTDDMGKTQ